MPRCDYNEPWYHGSPEKLTFLRAGSWVTQFRELAKGFSHKPVEPVDFRISMDDDCRSVRHNGTRQGFLYQISEAVGPDDVTYLPNTARTHWQTQRELQVRLLAELPIDDPPQLTDEEIEDLRKIAPDGTTGFIGAPDEP
jgi:hypothetical protein